MLKSNVRDLIAEALEFLDRCDMEQKDIDKIASLIDYKDLESALLLECRFEVEDLIEQCLECYP